MIIGAARRRADTTRKGVPMQRVVRALTVLGGVAALVVLSAGTAFAHADRDVGPISLAIGFGTEPGYVGQPNSVQVLLNDRGNPVVNLGDSLKVEVSFGDQQVNLPLEPDFEIGESGTPGDYRAWFIPSQAGKYTIHLTGSVHGTKIDLSLTSSPTTFDEIQDPANATFPAVNAPTNEELASRIEQESSRTSDVVAAAQAAASDAKDAADTARTVGLVGVVLGAIGVIAGVAGVTAARRKP
jgi:hypothetical protein